MKDSLKKKEEEIRRIKSTKLPPLLKVCVQEYNKVGDRNPFIWKCMFKYAPFGTFSEVPKKYKEPAYEIKVVGMLFVALLDDIADKSKDIKLLNEAMKIPFNNDFKIKSSLPSRERGYLRSSKKIWDQMQKELRTYPKYKAFEQLFRFDYQQVFDAIRFGYLVNRSPELHSMESAFVYLSDNMQMVVNADIDLMCIDKFSMAELGVLRQIVTRSQIMGRISNCLGTWKRELSENDFSSVVLACALDKGVVTVNEIKSKKHKRIMEKIEKSKCEQFLLRKWERCRREIRTLSKSISSIDAHKYLDGIERILGMYKTTRGLI